MTDHPTLERLVERALGRGDSSREIAAHLEACASCREAEGWAAALAATVAAGPPRAAPEAFVERALAIPSEHPHAAAERRPAWSIARLVEDAFARPLLAGVRGSATGRRFVYALPGGHADVEIAADPDDGERFRITTQVLFDAGGAPPDLIAILARDGSPVSRALGDESGTFAFRGVPPGEYRLEILAPAAGRGIRIGGLALETAEP